MLEQLIYHESDVVLGMMFDNIFTSFFLKVYTKCGRRAMPTMMMGSAATFIDCDDSWKLLLVTRKGSLYLWDLFNRKCILHDSLSSLISSDVNLSSKGMLQDCNTLLASSKRCLLRNHINIIKWMEWAIQSKE